MKKIMSLRKIAEVCKNLQFKGRKVGLVTGCFDILHIGHIRLFLFAKKHVDSLVVGVDSDVSVLKSKGESRPVHTQRQRCDILSELGSVDLVFPISTKSSFQEEEMEEFHNKIVEIIRPDFLVTAPQADKYWKNKKKRARKHGIAFLPYRLRKQKLSTSIIVEKLRKEF